MNKIVSIKKTSAIFLAIVLVAGTFAVISPFITGVNAQSETYYGMDKDRKSYGKDVSVKSIKCNNINVNVNGLELNGLPPALTSLLNGGEADEGQYGASSYGIYDGQQSGYDNNNSFKFVCINNNNNTVVVGEEEEEPVLPEPPISECEECFEDNLNAAQLESLEEAIAEGYPIFFRGEITDVFSIAEFCELIEEDATFSDLRGSLENLFESLPSGVVGVDVFNDLALCIAEALDIEIPPPQA